ncbi:hypothetical protein [Streptomyces cyaneofuscatus]|uniref:hypothetical protein n=1 Tax=Streptomyces cyaneofuscatus TaxID=66883 RepID=UPI00365FFE63
MVDSLDDESTLGPTTGTTRPRIPARSSVPASTARICGAQVGQQAVRRYRCQTLSALAAPTARTVRLTPSRCS